MLVCSNLQGAVQRLWDHLFSQNPPGSPPRDPPPSPRHPCDPLEEREIASAASSVRALAELHESSKAILDIGGITVGGFEGEVSVKGRCGRHEDPSTGFEYVILLNKKRMYATIYEMAVTLIHELKHISDCEETGFFPGDVAALLDKKEYRALYLQRELRAFQFQLAGAQAIYDTDKQEFEACWQVNILKDEGLAYLNSDNISAAKKYIKSIYTKEQLESAWRERKDDTPSEAVKDALKAYKDAGKLVDPAEWAL